MVHLTADAHLVVLGVKVNSWAWGLEQISHLSSIGQHVVVLDFGTNLGRSNKNKRSEFQENFLSQINCTYIDWKIVLKPSDRRRIIAEVRTWLKKIQKLDKWHLCMYEDLPLGRILMSNYARTAGTKEFPLSLLSLGSQLKITSQAVLALRVYEALKINFTQVSVSNGRSPVEAGVLFGARRDKKETFVLERGATTKQWFTWKTSSHYSPDWWEMLLETANSKSRKEFLVIANDYWDARLKGWDSLSDRDWASEFNKGSLPSSLPEKFVTFFCTSEHESPSLPEFECSNLGFQSQQVAVRALAEICRDLKVPLVIKRHPNSIAVDKVDREEARWSWTKKYAGITYIGPSERVDTYALLSKTSAVVTFKSSVGIEAAALDVPSRAMGPAEWACTEETRIWTEGEVRAFISNPTLLKKSPHLEWGYLASTFGQDLKIFEDITGGYAIAGTTKYFSSERYLGVKRLLLEKFLRKIWAIRIQFFRSLALRISNLF